ncbi:ABC transporter ATP-binding protein [uncultured Nitratireductor sp.]|uniref:ABC transporter ATP-binding protein n=1 Tax=uncultured Nitratireductor sp. TaxID=520953 RepID=UPI0025CD7190|nr:ABC transporter ATP-binding protein [uncultured Nitratireductor sp.]
MTADALTVRDLRVHYHTPVGPIKAVDGVSFTVHESERFGLVGESGSGKTTAAFAILQLTKPPARIESGSVMLDGTDLVRLSEDELRSKRFSEIALIPQGAMNSLNPVIRINEQMADVIRAHDKSTSKAEARRRVGDALERVGLKREVADKFPHELSGGMKQRVCIAMAITLKPKIIVADEPTSALDVVTQRQVMETLASVQKMLGASLILVGHDMGLMAQFVDRIGVMYAGRLVEVAPVADLFQEPLHPYSRLLISSLPSLETKGNFKGIPGIAPSLRRLPPGCPFNPRCPSAMPQCTTIEPTLVEVRPGRWVSCHLY